MEMAVTVKAARCGDGHREMEGRDVGEAHEAWTEH